MNGLARGTAGKATWVGAAFVVVCFLGGGHANAAKVPKEDICHFDADTGLFTKISVSGNAKQKHLNNHGDALPGGTNIAGTIDVDENCIEVNPPDVIARAYIDKNREPGYQGDKDIVIAELLDSDGTPGLTVGDTIVLGQYPLTFDPCPTIDAACTEIGNYGPVITPITVAQITPTPISDSVTVLSPTGTLYRWRASPQFEVWIYDTPGPGFDGLINDFRGGGSGLIPGDGLFQSSGEPNPSDPVASAQQLQGQDDYFIAVELNLP